MEEYGDERRKDYECNRVCRTRGGVNSRSTWRQTVVGNFNKLFEFIIHLCKFKLHKFLIG